MESSDGFLYGVCYYPEHWDASRHSSDLARIAAAGFQYVRMGEGAWGYWEPEEGRFQFELFDRAIDLCRKNGLKVILGTPTYCGPAWVSERYPEVLRWNFERQPMAHGSRRNFSYTSPKYWELSDRLVGALAEHYKHEHQVIAWQLDNEFNCHMDTSYAPSDDHAFQAWLRERYRTIAKLNLAWGTRFWSQQYSSFDQVHLPAPTATYMNPSQLLDESRFISDCVVKFARRQAAILRHANPAWRITHNGLFGNINGPDLARELDFFSHDQYPLFWTDWTGYVQPLIQARSLSFPFGVLEQQSGPGGQMEYLHRSPRPGEIRLWAWQSIAHGANLLSYFRWRTCPYGSEQHWHGLIDQDDRDSRRLAEAVQVGEETRAMPAAFFKARVTPQVAVMRDFDNQVNDRRINTYTKSGRNEDERWIAAVARAHVPVDVVWTDSSFDAYRVLVIPHLKMASAELAVAAKSFVEGGGTLVLGAQSGLKDSHCHIVEGVLPGVWREIADIEVEDWTSLPGSETRCADLAGEPIPMGTFVERLLLGSSARAAATWRAGDPLLAGSPAISVRTLGKGRVVYIGGYLPAESVESVVSWLMPLAGVFPLVDAPLSVEVVERRGDRRWWVLLNHSGSQQTVRGIPSGAVAVLVGGAAGDRVTLDPYGVEVIELHDRQPPRGS